MEGNENISMLSKGLGLKIKGSVKELLFFVLTKNISKYRSQWGSHNSTIDLAIEVVFRSAKISARAKTSA